MAYRDIQMRKIKMAHATARRGDEVVLSVPDDFVFLY
jgi:hypothetical protein